MGHVPGSLVLSYASRRVRHWSLHEKGRPRFFPTVRRQKIRLVRRLDLHGNIFHKESAWPVLTHFLAVFISALSVMFGVRGIERVNMALVPVLLLIILFTFVWSLTREYADQGITFLFTPSWESFGKPRVWVDAVSQNAFDTGAGMGLLVPYSTFMTQNHGVVKYSYFIPAVNNLVSLICGILIFSTVFSTLILTRIGISHKEIVGIMKDSGPASTGITFIWIPVLFESIGGFGRVLAILFFLCLSFAGITSLISNMELCTHTLYDFGVPRKFASPVTAVLTFLVGLMSALNIDILTNQDFVWAFALLINGLMFQLMVIRFGTGNFRKNVINEYSTDDWHLFKYWEWIIKVVAPLEAVALIVWWAIDLIDNDARDGEEWYKFGKETLVTTLTQWIGVMVILILINGIWLWVLRRRGSYSYFDNDEKTHLLSAEDDDTRKESSYTLGDKNKLHNTFEQTSEISV
ncbi:hypothetical protein CHS0354_000334 [Potamilus streckersoni]|uniref:Uncharacterized protein n=1 Tax=Potamilus streckersoni TaxID=2493646 RepID=A0AAE0SFF5_9BIVA|nr:hypothetical protein CHS0354_000334 [Potamilus streckersoni]